MEKFLTYATNEILKKFALKDLHLLTVIVPSERSKWHLRSCFRDAICKAYELRVEPTENSYKSSL